MVVNFPPDLLKEKRKVPLNSSLKKYKLSNKFGIGQTYLEIYKFVNFIFFYLILFLLPKQIILSDESNEYYIKITVNQEGEQQIISDDFNFGRIPTPEASLESWNYTTRKYYATPSTKTIKLSWDSSPKIKNFSYMFSNLKNINEIHIYHILGENNINFSYTFLNCVSLSSVSIIYDKKIVFKI